MTARSRPRTRLVRALVALAILALAGALVLAGRAWHARSLVTSRDRPPRPSRNVSVAEALASGGSTGFARALAPRRFVFPEDHGPHPGFRNEWWYYTGNLATAADRRFGYQLTFFRIALAPWSLLRRSAWATTELWMAHLAVTDIAGGRFIAQSRLARGALGLAGADAVPLRVWLEDWSVRALDPGPTPAMRLAAAGDAIAIDLTLESVKRPALEGERGLSVKGREPGQASYYDSLTRLATRGTVRVGGTSVDVRGTSWMDREWSTSALARDQVGWDWFALALDDGRELMAYRLRRADGTVDPASAGTIVARGGSSRTLRAADVTVDILGWWSSPRDGARSPARWRVAVPGERLVLVVKPRLADQEWTEPVRYWEGAVVAEGRAGARTITGEGYVELVGYARQAGAPAALAR